LPGEAERKNLFAAPLNEPVYQHHYYKGICRRRTRKAQLERANLPHARLACTGLRAALALLSEMSEKKVAPSGKTDANLPLETVCRPLCKTPPSLKPGKRAKLASFEGRYAPHGFLEGHIYYSPPTGALKTESSRVLFDAAALHFRGVRLPVVKHHAQPLEPSFAKTRFGENIPATEIDS